ncbi:MAG: L-serine ammonia-lyase, iron-sulfur-dependent, subunit beta [Lachnospiraceae bacterium]|nr:L-serine ammonia-lyase, iron-sulfur-dependent, subunit beta [Lachnospiraceae bacterium]
MNIYDILGPIMIGPSSSHTAGAVRIGLITRRLLGEEPVKACIFLSGSFGATGRGHGTDRALAAGLLGMKPDDIRVPDSLSLAEEKGLQLAFEQVEIKGAHPNTARLLVTGQKGRRLEVQASSLGGGRIGVDKLEGIPVSFTGEAPTLIVRNVDQPGCVAQVTGLLAKKTINISTLQLYRDRRGGQALMVVEADQNIPGEILEQLEDLEGIQRVIYVNMEE